MKCYGMPSISRCQKLTRANRTVLHGHVPRERLAGVTVIDRGHKAGPSHPDRMGSLAFWDSQKAVASSGFKLTISGQDFSAVPNWRNQLVSYEIARLKLC